MRATFVLMLVLVSGAVSAEEWVALCKSGQGPQILVDSASIQVLDSGMRRATTKLIALDHPLDVDGDPSTTVSFMIYVTAYERAKQMTYPESAESHHVDGYSRFMDLSQNSKWYAAPPNPAADPAIAFVCAWEPK